MKYQMENRAENLAGAGLSCVFRGICEQFFFFWQVFIGFLGQFGGCIFIVSNVGDQKFAS